jgi:hypothetical protein
MEKMINKGYSETPTFCSSIEANQFVDDWASKITKFLKQPQQNANPMYPLLSSKSIHTICFLKMILCWL